MPDLFYTKEAFPGELGRLFVAEPVRLFVAEPVRFFYADWDR